MTALIISITSALIALSSLFLSLVKYNKHEKRLNEQQKTINQYQLRKIQEEEACKKKALIKGNIVRDSKGSVVLKIFNSGESNANNVRVEILSSKEGLLFNDIKPIELINPHRSFDFHIFLCEGHASSIKLCYTWDDDFANRNTNEEHLQIL